jgi:hypothetical protein
VLSSGRERLQSGLKRERAPGWRRIQAPESPLRKLPFWPGPTTFGWQELPEVTASAWLKAAAPAAKRRTVLPAPALARHLPLRMMYAKRVRPVVSKYIATINISLLFGWTRSDVENPGARLDRE